MYIFRFFVILALIHGIDGVVWGDFALAASRATSTGVPEWVSKLPWKEEKGTHFVAYGLTDDVAWRQEVLTYAERYYQKISDDIGYGSVEQSWTWEDRVRIYIFPNKESFQSNTGWPAWSRGGVIRRHYPKLGKNIISYKQESLFLTEVLPHEIAHLMLREFLGADAVIPLWFEEGMAQLQEENKRENARKLMVRLAAVGNYIPFEQLFAHDIRREKNPERAMIFYSQSVSILDFLLVEYGLRDFQNLCRKFRDGKNLEDALFSAYTAHFSSLDELEKKWLRYIKRE